jgi:SAM-dependent methyltransferase
MSDQRVRDIIDAYDRYADQRDQAGLSERKRTHVMEATRLFRRENAVTVLEIGSGPGNAAQVFKENGFVVECVDISPRMIQLVKARGIEGQVLDCRNLGRLGKHYDAVFSVNCLLHVPSSELADVLHSIRAIMRPDGIFVLGLWGGEDFEGVMEEDRYEPKRFFVFYSQRTLLAALAQCFQIEEYRRAGFGNGGFFHKVVLRAAGAAE